MQASKALLFELGCEELPPKSLFRLSQALCENIQAGLTEAELGFDSAEAYATPRRLAVIVKGLASSQADKTIEKRGPAVTVAFLADGSASQAAQGFARSCGVTVEELQRIKTDKGSWLAYRQHVKGQPTESLITDIIIRSLNQLPIAKRMRWGDSGFEFARPVHWVVLLLGHDVVETEILGLPTDRLSQGHRFHGPEQLPIHSPADYIETLYQQGKVIVDFEQRKNLIRESAEQAAAEVGGLAHIEEALLEEITAINEWPVPITGRFDEKFLDLPVEVLITTMQSNQKYVPVKSNTGDLLPWFITFSNIESKHPLSIQQGNERVILPRLADAEFFWNQDRKRTLASRVDDLEAIVFQEKLGSLADKTVRVSFLVEHICEQLHQDDALVKRAAKLAKTDLVTEMVSEFAGLQGTMGRYYALADGEPAEVSMALEEQYFPKQSGSAIPTGRSGQVLAIAEKIDTLSGIFSAGLIPTGDKDPYALRRATLGILRIIIEAELDLDMVDLLDVALAQFKHDFDKSATRHRLVEFVFERLKGYCLQQSYRIDEFEAVFSVKPACPLDFMQRIKAVKAFRQLPEAESLAAANKRIINILKKSAESIPEQIGTLIEPQEKQLLDAADATALTIQTLLNNKDYQAALNCLAKLKQPVDAFFDHVMVNSENQALRHSRLALLAQLSNQFLKIADISKLQ